MEFYEQVLQAKKENKSYAIATVVKTEGTAPRSAGSKMLVYGDGSSVGTVGGGVVEYQAVQDCLTAIKTGEAKLKTYSVVPQKARDMSLICGNQMTLFIEPGEMLPRLYLCGSGHVAQAVLPLAKSVGFHIVCLEVRKDSDFEETMKGADERILLKNFSEMDTLDVVPGSFFIVCSFSHKTDGDILEIILKKEPAYVGMLGGKPKIQGLFRKLREQGYDEEVLKRIYAPIGLDLGGEQPSEIAVSIIAELLSVRYGRSCRPMRDMMQSEVFPL